MDARPSELQTLVNVRLSATMVMVRDAAPGLQALLLKRVERGDQNSGAWVFPGGLLDSTDRDCHGHCNDLSDAMASRRLGVAANGLDFYVAALRECFEESGLLLMEHGADLTVLDEMQHWRTKINERSAQFSDACAAHKLKLATSRMHLISHWVTPLGMPKRFDTRFFLAGAPAEQVVQHDGTEMVDHRWVTIREVLAVGSELRVVGPTHAILHQLSSFANVAEALSWAAALDEVPMIMPRLVKDALGRLRAVLPMGEKLAI